MKQRSFAEAAGISTGHLSYIERGVRRPGDDKLAQIARILKVSPAELIVGPEAAEEYDLWLQLTAEIHQEASPTLLFGTRLREYRLSRGLSMQDLARLCVGIQPWQIREFEVAGRQPEIKEMFALARALGFNTVDEFSEVLSGIVLEIPTDLGSQQGRSAIMRGINRAVRALDGAHLTDADVEAGSSRKAAKSRSLDGDLLAEHHPLLAGAVIRLVRVSAPRDQMLCVVMNGNAPAGIGRMISGSVPGPTGAPLIGDVWRVESINYLQRVF